LQHKTRGERNEFARIGGLWGTMLRHRRNCLTPSNLSHEWRQLGSDPQAFVISPFSMTGTPFTSTNFMLGKLLGFCTLRRPDSVASTRRCRPTPHLKHTAIYKSHALGWKCGELAYGSSRVSILRSRTYFRRMRGTCRSARVRMVLPSSPSAKFLGVCADRNPRLLQTQGDVLV